MKFIKSKKALVLLAVSVVAVVAAVAGYAYWTTSGNGTGSAATGDSQSFVVTQVGTTSGLVPGGTPQSVQIKVNNPASYNQYLTSLSFEVDPAWSADADGVGGNDPCTAADFALTQPTASGDLASGDHTGAAYNGTIQLINSASNQDNCKNVSVDLLLHAN